MTSYYDNNEGDNDDIQEIRSGDDIEEVTPPSPPEVRQAPEPDVVKPKPRASAVKYVATYSVLYLRIYL